MRQIEIEQSRGDMGVVGVERRLRRQILRRKVADIRTQVGSRIGTFEIPPLPTGGSPQKRKRLLVRPIVVVHAGQRIVIIQDGEVGRKTKRCRRLIARPYSSFLIIVQAGAEVDSAARSAFKLAGDGEFLTGAKRRGAEADVAPLLALL